MAKLTSLADLAALLPEGASEQASTASAPSAGAAKVGYDGKPQTITIKTEKRTGTKTVTLVGGFQSRPDELDQIFQTLKKRCGTGGKLLDNAMELQGDHKTTIRAYLSGLGFKAKD